MLLPGLCDLSSQAELRKALDRIDAFEAPTWLNFHNLKKNMIGLMPNDWGWSFILRDVA